MVYAWPAFSVYPHLAAASGARAIEVAARRRGPPRPRGDGRRDNRRDAARADLQPEQPDLDGAPARARSRHSWSMVPRHVCVILDEAYCEFSLTVGDPYASVELLEAGRTSSSCATFSKVYGLAGLRVGYALCGRWGFRTRRRPGAPAVLPQRRRPGRGSRGAQAPGRGRASGRPDVAARLELSRRLRELGVWVAESDANFIWMAAPRGRREEADVAAAGLAERACSSAPALRSGARVHSASRSAPKRRTSGSSVALRLVAEALQESAKSVRAERSTLDRDHTTSCTPVGPSTRASTPGDLARRSAHPPSR